MAGYSQIMSAPMKFSSIRSLAGYYKNRGCTFSLGKKQGQSLKKDLEPFFRDERRNRTKYALSIRQTQSFLRGGPSHRFEPFQIDAEMNGFDFSAADMMCKIKPLAHKIRNRKIERHPFGNKKMHHFQ
jgi:hypothetical protein